MRKNYKYLILEKLADVGEASLESLLGIFDIADAIMSSSPEAYRKSKRSSHHHIKLIDRKKLQSKMILANVLSSLKKEGLVVNKKRGWWSLVNKRRKSLRPLLARLHLLRLQKKIVSKKSPSTKKVFLIVFDIPEAHRRERNLLRSFLRSINFKPLQKSVWIGHRPLEEDFIKALNEIEILPYIHIFTVNKKETINL